MAANPVVTEPVKFPNWARLVLGLLVGLLGYLVAGDLHISQELRGLISVLVALLGSFGVVPPRPGDLPSLSPQVRVALSAVVAVAAYVVNTLAIDPTVRGVIVAVLALAASVGIVPPQSLGRT